MEEFVIKKIEELCFTKVKVDDVLWPHVLDSITIVELSVELENNYGITISIDEIIEENFKTVNKIIRFIEYKLSQKK